MLELYFEITWLLLIFYYPMMLFEISTANFRLSIIKLHLSIRFAFNLFPIHKFLISPDVLHTDILRFYLHLQNVAFRDWLLGAVVFVVLYEVFSELLKLEGGVVYDVASYLLVSWVHKKIAIWYF